MAEAALSKKRYTYEDYLKTPDDERYELIEGDLFMTPSPKTDHQRISGRLEFKLREYVMENDLGEVFDAPYDVYFDEEDVVQPDILYVAKDRLGIIGEKNIQGAPDLIVEILSEGTAYRDAIQKKVLYARHGVKEYWIVAPKEKMIEVYEPKDGLYQLIGTYFKDETVESRVLQGFKVDLKEIF
ncbi:MAG: Uma2 family endonuclease [Deltaproteobacteria bacterium]|nr:Uma2 family endonuclease [Deltaproteobacteria bacterium]